MLDGNGDYDIYYKREKPLIDDPEYGKQYAWKITMVGGGILYAIFFIFFEGPRFFKWIKEKINDRGNQGKVGNAMDPSEAIQLDNLE